MSDSDILFSIIIPAYNYASTLRRAVHSVTCQLKPNCELIVIDDGSTDDTVSVVAQLRGETPEHFRYIRKTNGGAASARNVGIGEAHGTYLIFLDADDELLPDALDMLEKHISTHRETRLVIGGHVSVSPSGKRREHLPANLPPSPLARLKGYLFEKEIVLCNGACAMHKDVFSRGNYPEAFRNAEDIPVRAQVLANYPCSTLRESIALIHKHDDSLRHQFSHAKAGGLRLVDEVFSEQRLGQEFQHLKSKYLVQRCLSLFRSAYLAKDHKSARELYGLALRRDWRVLFKASYTKKAIRLWFK